MKYLILLILLFPSLALAVDDATVQAIDSKASNANAKADGNNSRIQALEAEDALIHQRIDNIPSGSAGPQGPQGLPGTDGAPGTAGADGTDGLNCWDLNGNGVHDAIEDINSDGVFNALDCSGNVDLNSIVQRLTHLEERLQNTDFDNDGFAPATGDCNDVDSTIYPGATELLDGLDNNCDGQIDESLALAAPTIFSVTVNPEFLTIEIDAICNVSYDAPNGGEAIMYRWYRNGSLIASEIGVFLSSIYFSSGNTVKCEANVMDSFGLMSGWFSDGREAFVL